MKTKKCTLVMKPIMSSALLDGEKIMDSNIGLEETLGGHIGEKRVFSKLFEDRTISRLRATALGGFLKTLGVRKSSVMS